ncbi:hypothetical protein DEGR_38810 (plasmid) [Deinococcus grandis]|nr:hypothetical protein DEGR_38810 [Deinococcus grandis]
MQSDAVTEHLRDPLPIQFSSPGLPLENRGDLIRVADQVRQALLLPDVLQEAAVVGVTLELERKFPLMVHPLNTD